MRRAATLFTDEDRQRIARTVADAESRTSAEIVPVVAGDSGRYDRSEDVVGLWMGLALMAVMWYALPGGRSEPGSWDPGSWDAVPAGIELAALIGAMLVGFVVGAIVGSRVGWLRRLFTPARLTIDDKTYVVVLQAEFERLQSLAGTAIADDGPALPPPHDDGTYPALEYAGASLARKIIR
ncbi:MAG TPA: hypothetical protein VMV69_17445, partial [Pirellulales bacterium]|nr:hypothetical protein [Pirellulales bacterium]